MAAARGRQMPHHRPRAQPIAVGLDRRPRLDTTRRAEPAPVVDERGGIEAKAKRRGNVDHELAPNRDRSQRQRLRSEEHPSELPSLMRLSYAVFCLKKN